MCLCSLCWFQSFLYCICILFLNIEAQRDNIIFMILSKAVIKQQKATRSSLQQWMHWWAAWTWMHRWTAWVSWTWTCWWSLIRWWSCLQKLADRFFRLCIQIINESLRHWSLSLISLKSYQRSKRLNCMNIDKSCLKSWI